MDFNIFRIDIWLSMDAFVEFLKLQSKEYRCHTKQEQN